MRGNAWPIAHAAVAAGVAWAVAHTVLGHPQPFFAPIAAVVALAAGIGGRGTQAAQIISGVAVGVVVGEILVLVLGTGAVQVALAAGAAMLAMATATTEPLPLIQAGASAVLVALQSPESGTERMVDALVGGGIALFVSQIFFTPSPVALLKGASQVPLNACAKGLEASAQALLSGDPAAAEAPLERLRAEGRSAMSSLDAARDTSNKVARRTLRGGREKKRFARLDARAERLDLLPTGALLLSRSTHRLLKERVAPPAWMAPAIRDLARALEALAEDPESPEAMRRAKDAAEGAAREAARGEAPGTPNPRVALAAEGIRLVSADVARYAESGSAEP